MKLTEAKLKQMILEALRTKYDARNLTWVDDNIPTPDQKLRAKLGDEKYEKIQSLDPEQALIMKQSLDDMYPHRNKQETIESFMESHGFDLEIKELEEFDQEYINETYIRNNESLTVTYSIIYNFSFNHELGTATRQNSTIKYRFDYLDTGTKPYVRRAHKGKIRIPTMFELDLANEEDANAASTSILSDQRKNLEKIIGVSK